MVIKSTKDKGAVRHAVYQELKNITGYELRWALHWAFNINGIYFELHRIPQSDEVEFVARAWSEDRIRQITAPEDEFGTTYMTNEEILRVGRHYIRCWRLTYQLISNNC